MPVLISKHDASLPSYLTLLTSLGLSPASTAATSAMTLITDFPTTGMKSNARLSQFTVECINMVSDTSLFWYNCVLVSDTILMDERLVELRENAEKWKRLAVEAGREGGSCDKNMEAFVDEILLSEAEEVKDKDECSKGI